MRASKIAKETMNEDKISKNPRKTIGFLSDKRRMNVSLSRYLIFNLLNFNNNYIFITGQE